MAITKTQIDYLTNRLDRIVNEKIRNYREKIGDDKKLEVIIKEGLENDSINLKSKEEITQMIIEILNRNYGYLQSVPISELIQISDYRSIREQMDVKEIMVKEYTRKLYEAKDKTLDKFVLNPVDIETLLAEFEEVQLRYFFEHFDNVVIVNKPKDETDEETNNESTEQ